MCQWDSGPGGRVLVLGDYRQTVTAIRSLARAGYEVILGTDQPRSTTARSRYVSAVWTYDASCAKRFLDELEAYLKSERPDFVFVVGESQLRRLARDAGRFAPLAAWANAPFDVVARCFDKRAMYELTPALSIPTLPWRDFSDAEQWRQAAQEMGYPVVVKRKDSSAQVQERKALICASPDELDLFLADVRADPDPDSLVLQKFGAGKRHNCHVAADGGELVAYFQQKVIRTDELDDTGIGVAGVSVAPDPQLRDWCAALVKAVGYSGIGCIQFLVDPASGAASFLELNPRLDSTAALACRLGYDFPRLAVEIAARTHPAPLSTPYATGRHYHWVYGDLNAWRQGKVALPVLARSALRGCDLSFDWRDPLPGLHLFWRKFAEAARKRMHAPAPKHA